MTAEEAFQDWLKNHWRYGSSTDEARARKAWAAALNAHIDDDITNLEVDPQLNERYGDTNITGIFVRAQLNGKWKSADIATLTPISLHRWLRSRGGKNDFAEATVLILLGHWESIPG